MKNIKKLDSSNRR